MYQETGAEHAKRILEEYEAALERPDHSVLHVYLYCTNVDCCCSNFNLTLYLQYGLGGYRVVHPFACPYCGKFAVLDSTRRPPIQTAREHNEQSESQARRSVWRQVERRQHDQPGPRASDYFKEIDIEQIAELLKENE
jgi:hypothetical protein